MMLWVENTELVAEWVKARIPHMNGGDFGRCWATGILLDGRLIAGCVYHNYCPQYSSVEISFAADSPKWMTRSVVHDLFAGAFYGMDVNRVSMATTSDAKRTRKTLEGLGMTLEGVGRQAFGEQDAAVYSLLRREWEQGRWCVPTGTAKTGT